MERGFALPLHCKHFQDHGAVRNYCESVPAKITLPLAMKFQLLQSVCSVLLNISLKVQMEGFSW